MHNTPPRRQCDYRSLSKHESESRVSVAQIIQLVGRQRQHIIALALITLLILQLHIYCHRRRSRRRQQNQRETDTIPHSVIRRLGGDEDITSNQAGHVPKTDLRGSRHASLIMTAHVIVQPGDGDRQGDGDTRDDEKQRHVADIDGDFGGVEEDGVADDADDAAKHDKGVAVLDAVRDKGDNKIGQRGKGIDGDCHDLGVHRLPAQLGENGGDEEGGCIAGCGDADEHEDAQVDLNVGEDELDGLLAGLGHGPFAGLGG